MMASLAASLKALPVARVLDLVAAAPAGLKYDAMDLGGMTAADECVGSVVIRARRV